MFNGEEARTIINGETNLRVALYDKEILLQHKGTFICLDAQIWFIGCLLKSNKTICQLSIPS
jgi:hypothetical protein